MSSPQGLAGNPIVPLNEFINNKLTAKATRQLQGIAMNVYTQPYVVNIIFFLSPCYHRPVECDDRQFPIVAAKLGYKLVIAWLFILES